jgi:hypothetical protein
VAVVKRAIKRGLVGVLSLLAVGGVGVGAFVWTQTSKFDASMEKVYEVPEVAVQRSTDPVVLARGKHLSESIAACSASACHGGDLGGGTPIVMGPLATLTGPNVSPGGLSAAYSDAELARLIRHGIKKDGRSLRFMPVQDFDWLPDSDVAAIVSYIRTVPSVDRPNGLVKIGTLGKILDQRGGVALDIARRVPHETPDLGPPPSASLAYGSYVARLCSGCHGEHFSGGPLPGAPSSFPVPLNLTPHETGLASWSYEDFDKLLTLGIRKNGEKLKPFMPIEAVSKMDETEKRAMFMFFKSLPPTPFGQR